MINKENKYFQKLEPQNIFQMDLKDEPFYEKNIKNVNGTLIIDFGQYKTTAGYLNQEPCF